MSWVPLFTAVIAAPGTTAPFVSSTVPLSVAVADWPYTGVRSQEAGARRRKAISNKRSARARGVGESLMFPPEEITVRDQFIFHLSFDSCRLVIYQPPLPLPLGEGWGEGLLRCLNPPFLPSDIVGSLSHRVNSPPRGRGK